MTIDFSFSAEVEEVRLRVREFMNGEVKPRETDALGKDDNRRELVTTIIELRNEEIEAIQDVIAKRLGYRLVDHRLELYAVPVEGKDKAK